MKNHIVLNKYEGNDVSLDVRGILALDELTPDSDGNLGPRTMVYYRMKEDATYIVEESIEEIRKIANDMEALQRQAELNHMEEMRRARHARQD